MAGADKAPGAAPRAPGDCASAPGAGLTAGLLVLLAACVAAAHWPALDARAMSFDDSMYLVDNYLVRSPSWESARRFLSEVLRPSTVNGYYQPLNMISLMLDCAWGGSPENPRPFHVTSLTLHVFNTVLLALVLRRLFGCLGAAVGAALLFGLHPLTVEPVPWIGERKTLLSTFFALSCVLAYLRFVRRPRLGSYGACTVTYVLSLLSKPTTTPLPLLLLVLDFWPLARLSRRAVLEKVPLVLLGTASGIVTFLSQRETASVTLPGAFPWWQVPLTMAHNLVFYLRKMVWPTELSSHYPPPTPVDLSHPDVLAGVVGTIVLGMILVAALRWTRAPLAAALLFVVALLPTMGPVQFTNVIASDKYVYWPAMGIAMLVALGLARLWTSLDSGRRWTIERLTLVAVVLAVGTAEAVATRRQLSFWQTTEAHARHMLKLAPRSPHLYTMLGSHYMSVEDWPAALQAFLRSYDLQPDSHGSANLAGALIRMGQLERAVELGEQAVALDPQNFLARENLGSAWLLMGQVDQAIEQYRRLLEAKPEYPPARIGLGAALVKKGRLAEAIGEYREALRWLPESAEAHNNLGIALVRRGELEGAARHYREAIRLRPAWVSPLNNLAWLLATSDRPDLGTPQEAVSLAQRAGELAGGENPVLLDTLAASYAAAERWKEAVETAQRGLGLAQATRQEGLARELSERLALYRDRKPYRLAPAYQGNESEAGP